MNKELESFYDELFTMMGTKGWKILLENLAEERSVLTRIESINDEKDLYFKKGKLAVIDSLIHYKEYLEGSFEDAKENL